MTSLSGFRLLRPTLHGLSLEVAELAGIRVRLNVTLLLWFLTDRALVLVTFLLPAVLIHELAHAFVAQRLDLGSGTITLWFAGGIFVPNLPADHPLELSRSQRQSYASMIAAGPASNLALSLCSFIAFQISDWAPLPTFGRVNLALGLFNLLPLPMFDGGKLLFILGLNWLNRRVSLLVVILLSTALGAWLVFMGRPDLLVFVVPPVLFTMSEMVKSDQQVKVELTRVRDLLKPGGFAWTPPDTPLIALAQQEGVGLWLIRQPTGAPHTIDRPYLLRQIARPGNVNATARTAARPLYGEVSLDARLQDVVAVMKRSYLPVVPVVDQEEIVGTVDFWQIESLDGKLAINLIAKVSPESN